MPYRRTPIAATPFVGWDDLTLLDAQAAWSPRYRVATSRLVLPLSGAVGGELRAQRFVLDAGSALWLTPHDDYRLRQPRAGQRSVVLRVELPAAARRVPVTLRQRRRLFELALLARRGDALALDEGIAAWLAELLGAAEPAAPHPAVERARAYLADDPTRRDDLAGIARAAACSPFHLARLFRRHTGRTLHAYRDEQRLALALLRLQAGEANLAQLALALGYAHHSHFSAAFRRRYGATPAQLRRNLTAPPG